MIQASSVTLLTQYCDCSVIAVTMLLNAAKVAGSMTVTSASELRGNE